MSAQKVATAVGLVAFAALLLGVGAPALLPPDDVPAIQIVVPAAIQQDDGADDDRDDNEGRGRSDPSGPAVRGGDDDVDDGAGDGASADNRGDNGDDGGDDAGDDDDGEADDD